MPLRLSVIIPSYKRNEPLELCLEDLAAQRGVDRNDFEVVCVLQTYPAEATEKIKRQFGDVSGEALILNNLASTYTALGDLRRAIELHLDAISA